MPQDIGTLSDNIGGFKSYPKPFCQLDVILCNGETLLLFTGYVVGKQTLPSIKHFCQLFSKKLTSEMNLNADWTHLGLYQVYTHSIHYKIHEMGLSKNYQDYLSVEQIHVANVNCDSRN